MSKFKYLIRKRALGDVLWTEPVIRTLATGGGRLTVYTKYPELFDNFPLANVHFRKELKAWERALVMIEKKLGLKLFTLNLDEAYERRPDMHFLHAYQLEAGLPVTHEYPRLYLSPSEKARRFVEGRYILLHIESFSDKKFRQIFGVDWTAIVAHLRGLGYEVVLIGINPGGIAGTISVKTASIRDLIALVSKASGFIGIDSGPSHIAASLGIPALIFFGGVLPQHRHFPELFNGVLAKKPCEYDGDQALVLHAACLDCKLSADGQTAVCSTYSTDDVLSKISQLKFIE